MSTQSRKKEKKGKVVISLGLEEATESRKNGKEGAEDVAQHSTAFLHAQGLHSYDTGYILELMCMAEQLR